MQNWIGDILDGCLMMRGNKVDHRYGWKTDGLAKSSATNLMVARRIYPSCMRGESKQKIVLYTDSRVLDTLSVTTRVNTRASFDAEAYPAWSGGNRDSIEFEALTPVFIWDSDQYSLDDCWIARYVSTTLGDDPDPENEFVKVFWYPFSVFDRSNCSTPKSRWTEVWTIVKDTKKLWRTRSNIWDPNSMEGRPLSSKGQPATSRRIPSK